MHMYCCTSFRYARCTTRGREARGDVEELQDGDGAELQDGVRWISQEDGRTQ